MRVFLKTNGTVKEATKELGDYSSGTFLATITPADAIYLATDFPMNHFFIKIGSSANENTSSMNVKYWSNEKWESSVNTNDYTDALSNSGMVEFTPDRDKNWTLDDTSSNGNTITDLESIVVYDKYWTKITFDNSLSAAIELEWIGNVFSSDSDLFAEYPIFDSNSFLQGFKAGKTSWEEQHVKAAQLFIQDLKKRNIILGEEQLLDCSILMPAAVSKCAEIIFGAFGNDYIDDRSRAREEYRLRSDLRQYFVDRNNNAVKDHAEVTERQGWLSR